jgi:hypothetical protein
MFMDFVLPANPGEEYLHELAIAESRIEFLDRGVDQKENEDPNLDSGETVPSEVSCHVIRNRSDGSSCENVFDELFQEPHHENDCPIDESLEQDRLDYWSRVKTAQGFRAQTRTYQPNLKSVEIFFMGRQLIFGKDSSVRQIAICLDLLFR